MYDYTENNAALILSVCYGLQPDVAIRMTNNCGKKEKQEEIVKAEINKLFNKNYELLRNIFLDYAENNMSVKELAAKYKTTADTVRSYLAKAETYYLEFKGLIELGMLDHYAHPQLFAFLTRYGRYYVRQQKKTNENYKLLLLYNAGKITLSALRKETHMTLNTLCNI